MSDSRISRQMRGLMVASRDTLDFLTTSSTWGKRGQRPNGTDLVGGNPQEVLPGYVEALQRWSVARDASWYGYKMSETAARQAAAEALRTRRGVPFEPADIALTDGALAALLVCLMTISDPGEEVMFLSPPWFFYETLIRSGGPTPVRVRLSPPHFDLDVDRIHAAMTPRTRAVIVNSPNNPTGRVYGEDTWQRLAAMLAEASARFGRTIFLISDEAYSRIVFDGRRFRSPTEFYPHSFIVYTYGTTLLAPGQRIGYLAMPPTMPDREPLRRALVAAQIAAGHAYPNALLQHALGDLEKLCIDVPRLQAKRDLLVAELRAAGYQLEVPEGAMYLLSRCPDPDDMSFARHLASRDVHVLPGSLIELPGYLRLSLTASEAMIERALPVLADAAAGALQRSS